MNYTYDDLNRLSTVVDNRLWRAEHVYYLRSGQQRGHGHVSQRGAVAS